jgi:hypothetical protein
MVRPAPAGRAGLFETRTCPDWKTFTIPFDHPERFPRWIEGEGKERELPPAGERRHFRRREEVAALPAGLAEGMGNVQKRHLISG